MLLDHPEQGGRGDVARQERAADHRRYHLEKRALAAVARRRSERELGRDAKALDEMSVSDPQRARVAGVVGQDHVTAERVCDTSRTCAPPTAFGHGSISANSTATPCRLSSARPSSVRFDAMMRSSMAARQRSRLAGFGARPLVFHKGHPGEPRQFGVISFLLARAAGGPQAHTPAQPRLAPRALGACDLQLANR